MIDDKLLDEIEEKAKKATKCRVGRITCWEVEVEPKVFTPYRLNIDPPTALSLVAEIRELRKQNAALFKIAAAGRDYHEKPLADEVRG